MLSEGWPGDGLALSGLLDTSGLQTLGNILGPVQLATLLDGLNLPDVWWIRIVNHCHLTLKRLDQSQ